MHRLINGRRLDRQTLVKNFTNMSRKMWFPLFLFVLSMTFDIYTGAEFDNCTEFIQIKNVSLYDRDPKSLNDLAKRPLGFMSALIPFDTINSDAKSPCFQITLDSSTKQTIQVLTTGAVKGSTINVISDLPGAQPAEGSAIKTCQGNAIGTATIKYVFYCDTCDSDISIWVRLTVSPAFTDGVDFESWCDSFNAQYPDSLIVFSRQPPVQNPSPTSKAGHASLAFMWLVCLNLAFLLIHLLF